jgi:hypothetical protein
VLEAKQLVVCLLALLLAAGCGSSGKEDIPATPRAGAGAKAPAVANSDSNDKSALTGKPSSGDGASAIPVRMKRFRELCDAFAAAVNDCIDKSGKVVDTKSAQNAAERISVCVNKIQEYAKEMKTLGHFDKTETKELEKAGAFKEFMKATDRHTYFANEIRAAVKDPKLSADSRKALSDALQKFDLAPQDFDLDIEWERPEGAETKKDGDKKK